MADPVSPANTAEDVDARPGRAPGRAYPGAPLWVRVSGIITLLLTVLMILVMFIIGGDHGPMRHIPSGSAPSNSPVHAIGV
jgi:hypothetical protein